MKKSLLIVAVAVTMVLNFGACKKKEEEQAVSPHAPAAPGMMMPQGETEIVVPDSVKGKWSGVVLIVEDKTQNKTEDVTIKLGDEYLVPNTNLKLKVGDFLPDFKMNGLTITSASDQLNNPAVYINVYEGDNELFKGWLYSKFPSIHPFQHEKIGLTLKEGVAAEKKG